MRPCLAASLVLVFVPLFVACDDTRRGGGYVIVRGDGGTSEGHPDARGEGSPDARGEEPWDSGREDFDAGFEFPDAEDWRRDAGGRPDEGFEFPDAWTSEPDAGFEFPDAAPRDSGVRPDAGRRDAGFPDSSFPPPDAGSVQTNVSIEPGTSLLTINLSAGPNDDPIDYSVTLDYDNSGTRAEVISVVTAGGGIPSLAQQNFAMGPDHNAPPGTSSRTISKIPGSADQIPTLISAACQLGFPIPVTIELSNGLLLSDLPTPNCAP